MIWGVLLTNESLRVGYSALVIQMTLGVVISFAQLWLQMYS